VQPVVCETPAKLLWLEMKKAVSPFPKGVEEVPAPIRGTAFFPGGLGLWSENGKPVEFPAGQIMIVGHDFNSKRAYEEAVELGTEIDISRTWQVLRELLGNFGISPDRCFFTNVYMGLRQAEPETGTFPGARDPNFVTRCVNFFKRQLEVARPKLILTLGAAPFRVLAKNFIIHETTPKTLTACSKIYTVSLGYGDATFVALTHPSFYGMNVTRRRYGQLAGRDAEKAMIHEGLKRAF